MPSLVPGYEYDIFISYRQKDNRGDRWVSEFVEALKTELESTFKEEISIYFDINPHDGLLETHDVDASLKEKLKCLVFIPVLSRTYCDPKSFAWKNEFEAFVEQASKDQFGLKIRLPDGNTANRVLPVCIHDLDPEDIKLVEANIGAYRPVNFIYYSEGVNRPLRQRDDDLGQHPKQIIYRDQINKTALAVTDVIRGMKGERSVPVKPGFGEGEQEKKISENRKYAESAKQKLMIGAGLLAILLIMTLFVWPGFIGHKNLKRLIAKDGKIPIAVMPFQNMTNDTSLNIWQEGIQNILITNLSNSADLDIRQPESITGILEGRGIKDYTSLTPSVSGLISRKLEANVLVSGSLKQSGSVLRLNTQLADTKTGEALKSFQFETTSDNILAVADSISLMINDFIVISVMKRELKYSSLDLYTSTRSAEAFRYLVYGEKAWQNQDWDNAIDLFLKAIEADSNLYQAYSLISTSYLNQGMFDQAKEWCRKSYSKLDLMSIPDKIFETGYYQSFFLKDDYDPVKYLKQLIDIDDQDPGLYFKLGNRYLERHQYDKAIPEYERALEINKKWGSKPFWVYYYTLLGEAYHKTGQYKKEKKLYKTAVRDFPDSPELIGNEAILFLTLKDTITANRYIEKYRSALKDNSRSEAGIMLGLAKLYSEAGVMSKAEEYYRKVLSLKPDDPGRMNILAWFLIDKDQNIDEGLALIDRALELGPDNLTFLDTKAWGLYKKGSYKESLEVLQKNWDLLPVYDNETYYRLMVVKKASASCN